MTYAVERSGRTRPWRPLVGVAATLGALVMLDGPVLCPFRRCTGGYCPLCGVTRSAALMARLDPLRALALYPALPLMAVAVAAAIRPGLLGQRRSDRLLVTVGTIVVIVWLVRLAVGDIPAPTGLQWPVPIP